MSFCPVRVHGEHRNEGEEKTGEVWGVCSVSCGAKWGNITPKPLDTQQEVHCVEREREKEGVRVRDGVTQLLKE